MDSKKFLSLLLTVLFLLFKVHGAGLVQHDASEACTSQPLLKGKLDHSTGLSLVLHYTDSKREDCWASLPLTEGAFSIPDSFITTPQAVYLRLEREGMSYGLQVALAPGYSITLQADALSYDRFQQSLQWGGRGSSINKFYTDINNYHPYYDEGPGDASSKHAEFGERQAGFDRWYLHFAAAGDSLFRSCSEKYDTTTLRGQDTTFVFFKNVIKEHLLFSRLDVLMRHANKMLDEMPAPDVEKYVGDHFNPAILQNISDSQYLDIPSYRSLMGLTYSYLFYIFKRDRKLHPDPVPGVYEAFLGKIASTFKGPVRDYIFYRFIDLNLLTATNSYERFHENAGLTIPFLQDIGNSDYRDQLLRGIDKKEKELATLKTGDPAPSFSLVDRDGKSHALKDFAGQIVVLDFWASWCGPCRHETPYLKTLSRKYKKNGSLRFISIAVRDRKNDWMKALDEDKPDWLQLFDDTGKTAAAYFTNGIPKFVIIDRQGQIINFEAPAPGEGNKMEAILKTSLGKN